MERAESRAPAIIRSLRRRIVEIFPAQIIACVESLSEEQLWWRPNESSNSVGNLVLHVTGSTRHYMCRELGGLEFNRDRPAEFSERGPVPKARLLEHFRTTIDDSAGVLDDLDASTLSQPTREAAYYPTRLDLIVGVAVHLATHTGQIVYATKIIRAGSLDELWIRAHEKVTSP